jgi:hypothetical protein
VTASAARLDGTPVEATELWRRLDRGRASSAQPGDLQVTCPGDTPTARLTPVLHAARAAGWTAPLLVLGWRETVRRPLLGTFRRERTAHARARLVTVLDSKQPGTAVLRPEADPTCAALAAHLVDLQRQGLALALDVP